MWLLSREQYELRKLIKDRVVGSARNFHSNCSLELTGKINPLRRYTCLCARTAACTCVASKTFTCRRLVAAPMHCLCAESLFAGTPSGSRGSYILTTFN